jgi:MYXO-CTERM domain-containing protein
MFTVLLALLLNPALANGNGKTGSSTQGCAQCHGGGTGSTTVEISGPAQLAPGETGDYILTVTNSTLSHAGLDVSATGGSLQAGSNNQLKSNEITHSSKTAMTSGTVSYDFKWVAPSAEGDYSLKGAGNAVNGDGRNQGDTPANPITFSITVKAAATDDTGVPTDDTSQPTDDTSQPTDDTSQPTDDSNVGGGDDSSTDSSGKDDGCGCSSTPGVGGAALIGLIGLGMMRRRRA